MADKWADHLISAVQYNAKRTHTDKVNVHADNGETVGVAIEMTREKVVEILEAKTTFCTITWNPTTKKWKKGAPVRITEVGNAKFIRTDADDTAADNLGALPEF